MNRDEETVAFLVGDVARGFRQRFEAALAAEGLEITVGEARTLFHAARSGAIRQNLLAEQMGIEPMTLVNFLDRLERRGWIAREPDATDRRAKLVRVTSAVRPLVQRLEIIAAGVRESAAAGLSQRDMQSLRRTLQKMRQNLNAAPAGEAAA
jgi:MarR family transcriptional regulator for hemolysin